MPGAQSQSPRNGAVAAWNCVTCEDENREAERRKHVEAVEPEERNRSEPVCAIVCMELYVVLEAANDVEH